VAKRKSEQTETTVEVPAAMAGMMAINPIAAKAWMDLMSESARFVTERLRRDMQLQKDMLACKNPSELLQIQSDFMREAMEQYAEEASRYFKMAFQSAEDIEEDVKHGHRRDYDDIPV
jgi:hypothetical protein